MTIRLSSALRTALVTNFGLGYLLQNGHIAIYTGEQPASADAAATGTLIANITTGGGPVPTPEAHASGLYVQAGTTPGTLVDAGSWVMKGVASGEFGWWRWNALGAPAGLSTAAYRMDGAVGDAFLIADLAPITAETLLTIPSFRLTYPAT